MNNKQSNPFNDLIINFIVPLLVLNKGGKYVGPQISLIIATAIPLIYGLYDYIKTKNINIYSILGFVSVLLSGGLGLIRVDGHWFAVKEAAIPLVMGVIVFASAFMKKPMISLLVENEAVMDVEQLNQKLDENGTREEYKAHLKVSTIIFSVSFFLSAILNYFIGKSIFVPISKELTQVAQDQIRNTQIADMQWKGMVVIMLPCLIILAIAMVHVFKGIKKYTGLKMEEVMKDGKKS